MIDGQEIQVLRASLFPQIAVAAQNIAAAAQRDDRECHADWIAERLQTLNQLRDLLDQIGWRDRDPEPDGEIDPAAYGSLLLLALRQQLDTERHLSHTHDIAQRERAIHNALLLERLLQELIR